MMYHLAFLSCMLSAVSAVDLSAMLAAGKPAADIRAAAKVGPLPGIAATSYAGWFTVNASVHAEHFCWYWPALNGNTSAPLLVWLQGGPGASSLFGLFAEHGPYRLTANLTPVANPFTWANEYNVVYLDNPRGTGYSRVDAGALCTDWTCYGADFDAWIRQFQAAFGDTYGDVFITGESYGGV
jgi:vitellogenic carboxypeptidase-like protein